MSSATHNDRRRRGQSPAQAEACGDRPRAPRMPRKKRRRALRPNISPGHSSLSKNKPNRTETKHRRPPPRRHARPPAARRRRARASADAGGLRREGREGTCERSPFLPSRTLGDTESTVSSTRRAGTILRETGCSSSIEPNKNCFNFKFTNLWYGMISVCFSQNLIGKKKKLFIAVPT